MSKDTSTRLCSSREATVGGGEIPRPVPCETSGSSLQRGFTSPGGTAERQGRDLVEDSEATCGVAHFPSGTS